MPVLRRIKTVMMGVAAATGGFATLSWTPPTANTDDSAATLTGYNIYIGTDVGSMTLVQSVGAGATSYTFTGLLPGTYYFTVKAVTAAGESSMTEPVQKVIT